MTRFKQLNHVIYKCIGKARYNICLQNAFYALSFRLKDHFKPVVLQHIPTISRHALYFFYKLTSPNMASLTFSPCLREAR